jgi:hypothetical protein
MKSRNVSKQAYGKGQGKGDAGPDVVLYDDGKTDASGNPIVKKRSMLDDVESISGMGLSRSINRAPVKRYDPL